MKTVSTVTTRRVNGIAYDRNQSLPSPEAGPGLLEHLADLCEQLIEDGHAMDLAELHEALKGQPFTPVDINAAVDFLLWTERIEAAALVREGRNNKTDARIHLGQRDELGWVRAERARNEEDPL